MKKIKKKYIYLKFVLTNRSFQNKTFFGLFLEDKDLMFKFPYLLVKCPAKITNQLYIIQKNVYLVISSVSKKNENVKKGTCFNKNININSNEVRQIKGPTDMF